ncbi:HAD hydrolase, family IB [Segatella buccae]|uniref:HAD hydrolase, family IB n=1 Tax=Segatella buccae TaxID=28126 RepID=A0AAQ1UJ93_9BACT|nr:HAD family hydrolase [Segatella buccae]SUB80595.1 HAD hydrolase, family IB [Segatella buccae]
MKRKVYCFDFDGTLTTKDTLLQFIRFAVGDRAFLAGFLRYSPLLVLMKLHLYPNWKAKQKVFSHFFAGIPVSEFDVVCRDFADAGQNLLRPGAMAEMERAEAEGAEVYVVSASIDNWVRPFFHSATVIGTQVEVIDGRLTGRFLTANCYGQEKVTRLQKVLTEPRTHYYIIAYGDSRGDKEMLAYADEGFYKPFRRP